MKMFKFSGILFAIFLAIFLAACAGIGSADEIITPEPVSVPSVKQVPGQALADDGRPFLCDPRNRQWAAKIDFSILNTDILPALQQKSIYWKMTGADTNERKEEIARKATGAFLEELGVPTSNTPDWFARMRDKEIEKAVRENRPVDYSFLNEAFEKFAQDPRHGPVDPTRKFELFSALVDGLISGIGDPFAGYVSPDNLSSLFNFSGFFYGIGTSIEHNEDNEWEILDLMKGGPAEESGLVNKKDVIVAVDGKSVQGCPVGDITGAIKGDEDTDVSLILKRQGKEFGVTLTRAPVYIEFVESWPALEWPDSRGSTNKSIPYEFPLKDRDGNSHPGIAYVQIKEFKEQTVRDLYFIFNEMRWEEVDGLVVDLRGNPGGLLGSVEAISGYFLNPGEVILGVEQTDGKAELRKVPYKEEEDKDYDIIYSSNLVPPEIPVAILVDGRSASASEVMSGAMQDNKRAVIVGVRTYGKGSVNKFFPLKKGEYGALYISVELWKTPNGRFIEPPSEMEKRGLLPDIMVLQNDPRPDSDEYIFEAIDALKEKVK